MKTKTQWIDRENGMGQYTNVVNNVYLSYQPNDFERFGYSDLDSANPETAIVLLKDKKVEVSELSDFQKKRHPDGLLPRFLIYSGDWREQLAELFPDVEKLKAHWKENGGHFFTDSLD